MLSSRHISIFFFIVLVYFTSYSQRLQPVKLNKYTQNDGLSSNYVTKILKDEYGFLWIGTQEGLNLFDGVSFQTFTSQSDPKRNIGGSMVQDLIEDHSRSLLWVQTSYAPICALDLQNRNLKTVITHDSQNRPYSEVWARSISLREDILWIGGLNTLSAYHIPSKSFLDIGHIEQSIIGLGEYNINKIIHDVFGLTWLMIDGGGIIVINQAMEVVKSLDLTEYDESNESKLFFWDVATDNEHIFLATSWGLITIRTAEFSNGIKFIKERPREFSMVAATGVTAVSDSVLLVSTADNLYQYEQSQMVKLLFDGKNRPQGLANIYEIFYDQKTDLVWLGSQSGLLSFPFINGEFTTYSSSIDGHQKMEHLNALFTNKTDEVYAGGNDGIYLVDTRTSQISLLDTAKSNFLFFPDRKSNIYVSSATQLFALQNNLKIPPEKLITVPPDLVGNRLNAAVNYNDSLIILSSFVQRGLTVWNTLRNNATTFHHDSINAQIPDLRRINYLFKGKGEDVFILTGNSIISFNPLDNSHRTYFAQDPNTNKAMTNFMDMNETEDSYFLGTYGDGMIETDKQFKVKKIYTTGNGLSNNCIYRIFNIKDQKLLMTSNNGLSILDLETQKFRTYYEGDGLHGNGFEQFCGYQEGNKIYVGGPGGFTIVDTDLLPDSSIAPILYPAGIEINTHDGKIDSTHLEMSFFTIPNNAFKTTLKFVAPDYKNAKRMKYRYKINELSEDWVDLGNQNFVDLIGVNPGEYHFEVVATNSQGTDSEPLLMTLDFLPKWYQATWFKVMLLLLVAGLVYLIQRYRMIQIEKQQLIRKEIANDLHDDIGSTLNSLKIFTHLAQSDTNNKKHIEQIGASITEATVGLRDMIWVLEDEQDTVYEIMERIKKFASPLCLASDIELISNVTATSEKAIPKKIKRNIFLIAKECINNSVKYADCSKIYVALTYTSSSLKLMIEDNGKGFNMGEITKGKGLESMEYRANQVQFVCAIESPVGKGTKIEVTGSPW